MTEVNKKPEWSFSKTELRKLIWNFDKVMGDILSHTDEMSGCQKRAYYKMIQIEKIYKLGRGDRACLSFDIEIAERESIRSLLAYGFKKFEDMKDITFSIFEFEEYKKRTTIKNIPDVDIDFVLEKPQEKIKPNKGPTVCKGCGMQVLGDLPKGLCPICEQLTPEIASEILKFATRCSPDDFAKMLEEPSPIPEEAKKILAPSDDDMAEDRSCFDCSHYDACSLRKSLHSSFNNNDLTKHSTRVNVFRIIATDCHIFKWNDDLLLELDL